MTERLRRDQFLLTHSLGPRYTARPGSRVPMFTSRCTPRACALAHPRHELVVGRSSAARFRVSGLHAATRHASARTDDHMTARIHLHTEAPRQAGQHRLAASWCAPAGAMGTRAQRSVAAAQGMRGSRMGRQHDRKQISVAVTCSRKGEFGYRPLDAGRSGAGSGYRGDAP